jgi:elongator complex protein 1
VAVIDGDQLLLTSFRHVVVPPPMSSAKLSFPSPVSMVAFAPPPNVNDLIVMMADGQMAVCKNNGNLAWNDPQILSVSFKNDMLFVYQLIWWKSDVLLGVTCKSHDTSCDPMSGSIVVEFQLSIDNLTVIESGSFPCEGLVQCFHGNHDTGSVAMEMADGKTYKYKGNGVMVPWLAQDGDHVTFGGTSCDQIASCMFDDDKECLVGLSTRTCQFFVNNVKVLSGCTSFAIHDQFILLTTNSHALQLVNRHGNPADVRVLSSDESLTGNGMGVASRRLERGSLLVGAVPHDLRVILQMPRGNLEVISPRALVLSHIRQLLDKSLYGEAFYIMRKHRINLNLLCDHNMEYFISNNGGAWSLITQLDNPSYINLFLTDLREDDVVSTMYPNLSRPGSQTCTGTGWYGNGSKVNLVCKTMRDVLSSTDRNKYMLSIITTHIKMIPQELDEVLKLIKDIKGLLHISYPIIHTL